MTRWHEHGIILFSGALKVLSLHLMNTALQPSMPKLPLNLVLARTGDHPVGMHEESTYTRGHGLSAPVGLSLEGTRDAQGDARGTRHSEPGGNEGVQAGRAKRHPLATSDRCT